MDPSLAFKESLSIKNDIVEWRRHIHANPEVGLDLPETSKFVIEKLKSFGYEPELIIPSGITCSVGNGKGKCILLRADMDALTMTETSGVDFASNNGCTHSCGHDTHTAMLLGAAKLLKKYESSINGTIKFMFQPGEEYGNGALKMVEAGILEGVDSAMALHIFNGGYPGEFHYTYGYCLASYDAFTIKCTGKQSHGAFPNMGVSALNIGAHIFLALQEVIAREISPRDNVTCTVGYMQCGDINGMTNTVQGECILQGTIRATSEEARQFVIKRVKEVSELTANVYRGVSEFSIRDDWSPPVFNNEELTREFIGYIERLSPDVKTKEVPIMMGGEDFSFVSEKVPSSFIYILAEEKGYGYLSNHHSGIRFDDDALPYGTAAFVACATNWLKNHQ